MLYKNKELRASVQLFSRIIVYVFNLHPYLSKCQAALGVARDIY